jgi:hypothetical protein
MKSKFTILILAVLLAVGFNSCKDNTVPVQDSIMELTVDVQQNVTPDLNAVKDASVDNDIVYTSLEDNSVILVNVRVPLYAVLNQLRLTNEQIALIRGFAKDYYDCINRATIALRESEKAIIDRAKAARLEVLAKLEAGEINREQAARQIANINRLTREALQNNPVKARVAATIKDCLDSYIAKIRRILTDAQLTRFNELLRRMNAATPRG